MSPRRWPLALALLAALTLCARAQGQAPITVEARLSADDPPDRLRKPYRARAFFVPLEAGRGYLFDVASKEFDTCLRLEDLKGNVLAENDDAAPDDRNSWLAFVAKESGRVRAVVTSSRPGATGTFRLRVTPLQAVGGPAVSDGKVTAKSPKQLGHHFEALAVRLEVGHLYWLEATSADFPLGLALMAGNVGLADDGPRRRGAAAVVHAPGVAGEYRALTFAGAEGATGAFRLKMHTFVAPPWAVLWKPSLPEAPPWVRHRRLSLDDPPDRLTKRPHKVHEVEVKAGKAYLVTLNSGAFNPSVRIEGEGRRVAPVNDAGTGAMLIFTPDRDGVCRVLAMSVNGRESGWYEVRVARFPDELAAARRRHQEARAEALMRESSRRVGADEFAQARESLAAVEAMWERLCPAALYPDGSSGEAATQKRLGLLLTSLGLLDEGRAAQERTLEVSRRYFPAGHPSVARALIGLGQVLLSQNNARGARRYFAEALAAVEKSPRPDPVLHSECLNNLAAVHQHEDEFAESAALMVRARAALEKVLPPGHPALVVSQMNLASVRLQQGASEEAARALDGVIQTLRPVGGSARGGLAMALNQLGVAREMQGRREEARRHYAESLEVWRALLPADHTLPAMARSNLAVLAYAGGRPEEGWPLLLSAARAHGRYAAALTAGAARADHAGLLLNQRNYTDLLLTAAGVGEPPQERLRELHAALLDGKAVSGAVLADRQRRALEAEDPKDRADLERLAELRRRLAGLLLRGAADPAGNTAAASERLSAEAERLERDLAGRVGAVGEWRKALSAGVEEIAERLPAGAALVELARHRRADFTAPPGKTWREGQYSALVLWNDGGAARLKLVPLGEAEAIDAAVHAWRQRAQKGEAGGGAGLRRLLWAPLAKALPRGTTRLVIAPDGALSLLPFEAVEPEDGKYLVESYQISYVSSGRDLLPAPRPKEPARGALLIADPAYDAAGGEAALLARGGAAAPGAGLRFAALPGFAREADAAAKLLRGRPGWEVEEARGAAASEEALLRASRPRLLYLVTHGFFLKDAAPAARGGLRDLELVGGAERLPQVGADPRLRSGLALAGANRWQERSAKGYSDGLLTALEVENLDLWGTELVVLSACETGLGEVQVGEGVLGLRRAFQLAGARAVLASLWKVPDAETERLMSDTLARWLKGSPSHEALREAQLSLIRHLRQAGARNGKQEAPPLYWAGFVCHGR